ncbi:MAG: methyltransferase family protein [Maricaulaceae bacterium]
MRNIIPPPILTLLTAGGMTGLTYIVPEIPITPYHNAFKILGKALIFIGLAQLLYAGLQFRKAKTTVNPFTPKKSSTLVVGGLYNFTRNPMYLAMASALAGLGIVLWQPVNILLFAAFIIYMTAFQIKPEEAALRDLFGDEYAKYCKAVRRWI